MEKDFAFQQMERDGVIFEYKNNAIILKSGIGYREPILRIPEGVTAIYKNAFQCNYYIKKVILSTTVVTIDEFAFRKSTVEEIVFAEGLKEIKKQAFLDCAHLKELIFPNSLTKIEVSAFRSCTGLKKVVLPKNIKVIRENVFSGCFSLKDLTFNEGLKFIERGAFISCGVSKLVLPDSLVEIGESAFAKSRIKEIVFGKGLKAIHEFAFKYNTSLESLTFPNKLTNINHGAFYSCFNLKEVTLNDGLEVVGSSAFCKTGITEITIPKSVQRLNRQSFVSLNLKKVYYDGNLDLFNKYMFEGFILSDYSAFNLVKEKVFELHAGDDVYYLPSAMYYDVLLRSVDHFVKDHMSEEWLLNEVVDDLFNQSVHGSNDSKEDIFQVVFETLIALLKNKWKGKEVLDKIAEPFLKYLLDNGRMDDFVYVLDVVDPEMLKKFLDLMIGYGCSSDVVAMVLERMKEQRKDNFAL